MPLLEILGFHLTMSSLHSKGPQKNKMTFVGVVNRMWLVFLLPSNDVSQNSRCIKIIWISTSNHVKKCLFLGHLNT